MNQYQAPTTRDSGSSLMRQLVHELDAAMPLTGVQTMAKLASDVVAQPRARRATRVDPMAALRMD